MAEEELWKRMKENNKPLIINADALKEAVADKRVIAIAPAAADLPVFDDLGVPACAIGQFIDVRKPDPEQMKAFAGAFAGADVVVFRADLESAFWREASHILIEAIVPAAFRVRVLDITQHWLDHPAQFRIKEWVETHLFETDISGFFEAIEAFAHDHTKAKQLEEDRQIDLQDHGEQNLLRGDEAPAKAYVSQFGALKWEDLDRPGPEHSWLIDDWLTEGEKGLIAGESKSGKSFLAIDMGMSIALGVPFFDNNVKQGLVIYQAGEGARGVKKRLRAYRKHHGIPVDQPVPFVMLQLRIDLKSKADVQKLIKEIKWIASQYPDQKLRAAFIDTLARAQGSADENSGKDIAEILDNIDLIREACDCAVILVHHMNASGGKVRGHSSIYGNIDQVIIVSRDKETKIRTALLDKQKDGEDFLEFRFKLLLIDLDRRADGKQITSCVVEKSFEEVKQEGARQNRFNLHRKERLPFRALIEALERFGEPAPPELIAEAKIAHGTTVVRASFWKKRYAEMAGVDEPDPEKLKRIIEGQLKLPGEDLMHYGVIKRHKQFLWWTGKPVKGIDPPRIIQSEFDFKALKRPQAAQPSGDPGEDMPF